MGDMRTFMLTNIDFTNVSAYKHLNIRNICVREHFNGTQTCHFTKRCHSRFPLESRFVCVPFSESGILQLGQMTKCQVINY